MEELRTVVSFGCDIAAFVTRRGFGESSSSAPRSVTENESHPLSITQHFNKSMLPGSFCDSLKISVVEEL
jgi:hypothetical protein